jgi:pimeloyl-ACP methyl ester carboxylesterase
VQIRRRRVFFIEGYEPKGADGFYRMFRREWNRFRKNWTIGGAVSEINLESADIASWDIETSGPNWQVFTRYEFLRLEHQIRENLAQPLWLQLGRTIRWMAGDLATGSLGRVFRASWRMGVLLSYSQVLLLIWFGLALAGGWAAVWIAGASGIAALAIGVAATLAVFAGLRPIADAMFVNQLNNCWPYLREFARGEPTGFDNSVELLAGRVAAVAKAEDADEILVVGHSAGAMLALATIERALKIDPDVGIRQPNIAVITVGSIMPLFALHPAAQKLRGTIRTISMEPDVLWADCQAREDFMNFSGFDPVRGVGLEDDVRRCNPLIWQIPFQNMISERMFKRMRFNYWRKHYQYIMSNERRAAYDYYMFVCGPAPFSLWAAQGEADALFEPDGFYRVPVLKAAE